ncbi:MAG: hypothetical protein KAV83_09625 [Desulfobacterales bacterium]|nr:hypothetical protein [Desulfobacterales bacterium]
MVKAKYTTTEITKIAKALAKKMLDIQAGLARVFSKYLSIIEPLGYSSEDFQSADPETLLGEIKKSGKVLCSGAKSGTPRQALRSQ